MAYYLSRSINASVTYLMGIAREIAELIKTIQADTSRAVERMEKGTADVQAGKAVVDKAGNSFISASQLLWTGII